MGNADHQSSAIFRNIVNSIGDGHPAGIGTEVVIVDATGSRFPTLTRIFKIAYELAFFCIHTDDGQMTTLKAMAQLGQILELQIALGTTTGGNLLLIDPQGIAQGMEQAGNGIGGNGNVKSG